MVGQNSDLPSTGELCALLQKQEANNKAELQLQPPRVIREKGVWSRGSQDKSIYVYLLVTFMWHTRRLSLHHQHSEPDWQGVIGVLQGQVGI